ncbi:MAG: LacI family DNA-binding transcriptional regulator [Gluconacetobacter diazotrophicus]|nr:LacI family DNA-binding transcriptional regulator [Gluconacetobacter diazotrophicus]
MRRRVSSQQVADRAGVSRSTVSMILNRSAGTFPAATRERVLAAAAALGYTPDSAARTLSRGSSDAIGLVIRNADLLETDGFVAPLLRGVGRIAHRHNHRVLVETVTGGRADELGEPRTYAELVDSRRVDGLIVLNPEQGDPELSALIDRGFPTVLLGSIGHRREVAVGIRAGEAVGALIGHLFRLGHRRIGHVTLSAPGPTATNTRLQAYRQALATLGLDREDALVACGDYSARSGFEAMGELLDRPRPPTAVFAANDTLALGALSAATTRGLRVPDDVAVVGFDDLPFAAFLSPPLTTVRAPAVGEGELAARHLFRILLGTEADAEIPLTLDTPLVVRASCGGGA